MNPLQRSTVNNLSAAAKSFPWINPIGGLGDALMLSGILKIIHKNDPSQRFNMVRRTGYTNIYKGHPAIAAIGFPPKDAAIIGVDYWSRENLGPGNQRAFQILARMFGLKTPIEERLFLPNEISSDPFIEEVMKSYKKIIVVAPASDSPRKVMSFNRWHALIDLLTTDGTLVVQVGRKHDPRIRNAYSLLGITTERQLVLLLRRASMAVAADNFVMHAAHLAGAPAIILWGPTRHEIYGYAEQTHFQAEPRCAHAHCCLGPQHPENYPRECPEEEIDRCMNAIPLEEIARSVAQHSSGSP
jgi:ADP-heptose:LPS heptosyltransferase